jgi:purine nucleosidase
MRWRFPVVLLFVLASLVATLALPVPLWRTGRMPVSPLQLSAPDDSEIPKRLWIDTDAACGHTPRTDVDDCLAVWLLLSSSVGPDVVGVSTVYGNAPLDVTDNITRALVDLVGPRSRAPEVHRGSPAPMAPLPTVETRARAGLTQALEQGRLTILALGPLTNVAHVLRARPDLTSNIEQLIAVMGRRTGHLFHPSEGSGRGSFLGHGPVFRDFNFSADPDAVATLVQMDVALTLIPYDAATDVEITREDLRHLAAQDEAGAWMAARADAWLRYWETDVGRAGFYPFDLMAAAYVVAPARFRCAEVRAWVGTDPLLFIPLFRPKALLVDAPEGDGPSRTLYCPQVEHGLRLRLREWMSSPL